MMMIHHVERQWNRCGDFAALILRLKYTVFRQKSYKLAKITEMLVCMVCKNTNTRMVNIYSPFENGNGTVKDDLMELLGDSVSNDFLFIELLLFLVINNGFWRISIVFSE